MVGEALADLLLGVGGKHVDAGAPQPRSAGETLAVELPKVPTRPLSAYRLPGARPATDGAAEVTR